jgi:Methyltransferase domain/Phosphotransferase enzyme family
MDMLLLRRVGTLLGKHPIAWERIERGYTPAERWVLRFADGSSAFAKVGTTPATAAWLRGEHRLYCRLQEDFLPALLGFSEHPEQPLLVLEDLSHAHWPPPWRPGDVERLVAALERVSARRPLPLGLADLDSDRERFVGWPRVEADPEPFLALGLCSRDWLRNALPTLLAAEQAVVLGGPDLVHGDVRSDNICLLPERVVLVDWNLARQGNAAFDLAALAPSLRLEGGPLPEELATGQSALAALVSGYFAANAGLPAIPDAPRVRWIQLRQLRVALAWVARALGLPPPDLRWAGALLEHLGAQLAAARSDEATWYAATEEVIGDAYLASNDPRAQSGKSGDETDWRWSRELVFDALTLRRGAYHVLDVGCANGYLMQSLARWGGERGLVVEPYGLEISWRLAALARRRVPEWADRIWVGNVVDWAPPRRFDLVHTGLDYVPPARRRACVERLSRDFLKPGGRLVLRAERVRAGVSDLRQQLEELEIEVGGVIERIHPTTGQLRRSVWIAAAS